MSAGRAPGAAVIGLLFGAVVAVLAAFLFTWLPLGGVAGISEDERLAIATRVALWAAWPATAIATAIAAAMLSKTPARRLD